jgi:glycosyltransferase involved in cell wall biosynthesis
VVDRDPAAHLVCCGDDLEPGTRARLLALARKLRLEDHVSLLAEREDLETVYAGLDLYAQASRSEGLSNALLEAMAHGVAVVATSVGGTAEAVADGVEGRLIPAGDDQSMAAAMVDLLGQPDLLARYGSAGRERVRTSFCIGGMLRRYECLYLDTLAARSAANPVRIPGPRPGGRPLRILYRLDALYYGGLEKQVMNLALGLDRSRFEPVVCWSSGWGAMGERLREAGIATPQVRLGRHALPGATNQIHELGADIFHSFSCAKNDRDARAASQAGCPVIVTNRGNVRHWDEQARLQDWETRRNGLSHAITACSQAVAWVCCNVERVPFSKIAVIYNGVAIPEAAPSAPTIRDELGIAPGTFLLGYIANYRKVKAHDMLLRAFRKLIDRWPQAYLVCCGADNHRECPGLPALAAQLGLHGRVSLLGARDDVDAVYRGLDLYVHSSNSEGLSNAVLEAMAHGLPVVATSVGGVGEAVEDGVTGYLSPPGDAEALCLAIERLIDNPKKRRNFGREARDRAERKFSLAAMVDAYSRFYERIADRAEQFREGAANAATDSPG